MGKRTRLPVGALATFFLWTSSVAFCLTASAAPSTAPTTAATIRVDETVLYRMPAGARVADTITSPDVRHVACVEERTTAGTAAYDVALDTVATAPVQWIVGKSLIFSPDGSKISWQTQQDGPISVIIDSVEHLLHGGDSAPAIVGSGYWMAGHVLFSKDGRHAAFPAQAEKSNVAPWRMIVDGKPGERFDALDDFQMLFSPDGSRLAYKATRGGKQCFVVDGVVGPGYDTVIAPVFSDNSARFAYVGKKQSQEFYVIDGKECPHFDMAAGLVFSADARRYAYVAGKSDKQMLMVDGILYKPFDGIGDLAFSPDGRRIAITAQSGPKWTAVIDGKESGSYDGTGALHFSLDGRKLAFVAGRGRQQLVIVDGKESPLFDGVGTLCFSPDAKQCAFLALDESSRVLVVDGQRVGPSGSFAFSPDGKHIARAVPRSDNQWGLAIDGTDAKSTYDGFPLGSRVIFDTPDTARTIAGRGNEILRVEFHVP